MKAIAKNKTVPSCLNTSSAKAEFEKNVQARKYIGKNVYAGVKDELHALYRNKCAYCESDITAGGYNHIEHYRPKSIYYWLAYTWDNLLLACPKCNIKKLDNFEVRSGQRAEYKSEQLKDLHNKCSVYDALEQPLLLNPEQLSAQDLRAHFTFSPQGELIAKTDRMQYTIDLCNLNRDELVRKRWGVLNDFLITYRLSANKTEALENIVKHIDISINEEAEYTAWREFLKVLLNAIAHR